MATYNGWKELREYRVWANEDTYACITVERHRNGWINVYADGQDKPYKTRDENNAYRVAKNMSEELTAEAVHSCPCSEWDAWEREECEDAARNVYGDSHGVRTQVVDMIENRELDSYEL